MLTTTMETCEENERRAKTRGLGAAATKRTITVHASGEVSCPPDLFSLAISVCSTKESAEAAQSSVKRRSEYIRQVLRNNKIGEKQVKVTTDVSRVEEEEEEEVCVQSHFLVQTGSLPACEAVRNLLVEKLDATVQCSAIGLQHSSESKAQKGQQAFKEAVASAKRKAQSVAQVLEVRLGPALQVTEKAQPEDSNGSSPREPSTTSSSPPTSSPPSLHERLRNATMTYTSNVEVTFETTPLRDCHHKKCPKH